MTGSLATALRSLEEGRFFEAHEAFEGLWRSASDADERTFLQAAAQLSAAAHKLSTGHRVRGALAIVERARDKLATLSAFPVDPSLEVWRAYAAALLVAAATARDGGPIEVPPFKVRDRSPRPTGPPRPSGTG